MLWNCLEINCVFDLSLMALSLSLLSRPFPPDCMTVKQNTNVDETTKETGRRTNANDGDFKTSESESPLQHFTTGLFAFRIIGLNEVSQPDVNCGAGLANSERCLFGSCGRNGHRHWPLPLS